MKEEMQKERWPRLVYDQGKATWESALRKEFGLGRLEKMCHIALSSKCCCICNQGQRDGNFIPGVQTAAPCSPLFWKQKFINIIKQFMNPREIKAISFCIWCEIRVHLHSFACWYHCLSTICCKDFISNFKNSKEKILVSFFFSNIHNLLLAHLHFSSDSVRMKTSPDGEDNHYLGMQESRIPNCNWNIIMAVILSQQEKLKNEIFSLKTRCW